MRNRTSKARLNSSPELAGDPGQKKFIGTTISGVVVKGNQLGRTIGFPTANLSPGKSIQPELPHGVFLVEVSLGQDRFYGLCNIGNRPTIGGMERITEVHILNFSKDIYGSSIRIEILAFIRKEKKFRDLGQLSAQINKDKARALKLISLWDKPDRG